MTNLRIVSLVAGAAILVTTFQNCGKAGFESAQDMQLDSLSTSTNTNTPFAFDATYDQIAYNSCWGTNASNKPAFFTLRAGAYSKYGVGITSEFITHAKSPDSGVKPVFPATEIAPLQIKEYLAKTTENRGAVPQLSLRSVIDLQTVYTASGGQGAEGVDYKNMLGDLTDDRLMDPMVNLTISAMGSSNANLATTPTTNYFPLMPDEMRNIDGSIRYNSNERIAQDFRDLMNGELFVNGRMVPQGMLTLTYTLASGKGSPLNARSPGALADTKKVYGKGYKLSFTKPGGYSLNPNNILSSVSEINLIDGKPGGTWDCSRNYAIIKKTDFDANPNLCPQDPYSLYTSGDGARTAAYYRNELDIVQKQFSSANWQISTKYRCIVPRSGSDGSCYQTETLSNGTQIGVEYDITKACYQGLQEVEQLYGSSVPTKRCLQYATICVRN